VDDPDSVIGEVGDLDDPGAGIGGKACRDVRAVLLVFVVAGQAGLVADGLDQGGDLRAVPLACGASAGESAPPWMRPDT
jgi:hypothetical protein